MTSLLKRFDEKFPLKEGAQTFSGKKAKDWLRAALLEMKDEVEAEKHKCFSCGEIKTVRYHTDFSDHTIQDVAHNAAGCSTAP
jgi:NifU-like protein involved in Fe-S cluster formation